MARAPVELWSVQTFGGFRCTSASGLAAKFRTKKTAGLAAFLAIHAGRDVQRDELSMLFWADSPADTARQSLRMALSDIRSVLGADAVRADRDSISLRESIVQTDVSRLEQAVRAARLGDASGLSDALDSVAGPFLPESESEDWVRAEALRIQDLLAEAATTYAGIAIDRGVAKDAVETTKRILQIVGCREDVHIAVIRLYMAQGFASLALAQFEQLERELDDTWGEPPSRAAIEALESAPVTQAPKRSAASEIPIVKGELIGRDEMLQDALDKLQNPAMSLLTFFGPGGSGKTALVLEALTRQTSFRRPVFADMTRAKTHSDALRMLQEAVGIPISESNEALGVLVHALNSVGTDLLVIDNFEQLVEESTSLIASLLEMLPKLKIAVTSRVALRLPKETLFLVAPLDMPTTERRLEDIRNVASIKLFEKRAGAVSPRFRITPDNAEAVIELCRKLDGLPLAIELAAARSVLYSPAGILANLTRSVGFLVAPSLSDDRHSSLVRTIDFSFQQLSSAARQVALSISLFSGAFTLREASELLQMPELPDVLEEIVLSSMLSVNTSVEPAEFWLLETIKARLRELLDSSDIAGSIRKRFVTYWASEANRMSHGSLGKAERTHQLSNHVDDYLMAIDLGMSERQDLNSIGQMLNDLSGLSTSVVFPSRVADYAKELIHEPDDTVSRPIKAMLGVAWSRISANVAELDQAREISDLAEGFADGDVNLLWPIRMRKGQVCKWIGAYAEARVEFLWALEHMPTGDAASRASCLHNLGMVAACVADYDACFDYHVRALEEARKSDDLALRAHILFDTGSNYALRGEGDKGMPLFEEAIGISQGLGSLRLEGLSRWQHGDALLSVGKPSEALSELKRSLALVRQAGFGAAQKWIFLKMSEALAKLGNRELATRVLARGITTREQEKRPLGQYEQDDVDKITALLKAELGEAVFQRCWTQGAADDWAKVIREALEFEPA